MKSSSKCRSTFWLAVLLLLLPLFSLLLFVGRPLDNYGSAEIFLLEIYPSDDSCRLLLPLLETDKSFLTRSGFRILCLTTRFFNLFSQWNKMNPTHLVDRPSVPEGLDREIDSLSGEMENFKRSLNLKLSYMQSRVDAADHQASAASVSVSSLKNTTESFLNQVGQPSIDNSAKLEALQSYIHESLSDVKSRLATLSLHKQDGQDVSNTALEREKLDKIISELAANVSTSLFESFYSDLGAKLEKMFNSSSKIYLDKFARFDLILTKLKTEMSTLRLDLQSQISKASRDFDSIKLSVDALLSDSKIVAGGGHRSADEIAELRGEIISFAENLVGENILHFERELYLANSRINSLEQLHHTLNSSILNLARELEELKQLNLIVHSNVNASISEKIHFLVNHSNELRKDILSELDLVNEDSKLRKKLLLFMNISLKEELKDINLSVQEKTFSRIKLLIDQSLERFAMDRTGQVDYALESAGGRIVGTRCTRTYTRGSTVVSVFGIPLAYLSKSPNTIIQPGNQPGDCWAFHGSEGQAIIRLVFPIRITGVSLEHVARSIAIPGTFNSAPRDFWIKALSSEYANDGELIGSFTYNEGGPSIQYFPVSKTTDGNLIQFIEFGVSSNHGNPDYTCVYRIRVHGNFQNSE